MSRRPATVRTIVDVDLPRPRDLDSPDYLGKRQQIFSVMGMTARGEIVAEGAKSATDRAR
ncbi:MAG: hypothetical protein EXS05_06985 [Planctomycetaceae bacterium]|nr:hypothetical protein [Planctomycetaceae bacterium]